MRTLGNVFLVIAAVAMVAFPFCYQLATRGAWFRSWMGRHLMAYSGVMALVVTFAILNFALPLPGWVRPLTWFLIGVVAWWRLILLFVVQHDSERRDQIPR